MYGYEADEVVGKANSEILHTPEDVALGKPQEIMQTALTEKTWHLMLNDYTMPKFRALQALEVLKASRLDLPITSFPVRLVKGLR